MSARISRGANSSSFSLCVERVGVANVAASRSTGVRAAGRAAGAGASFAFFTPAQAAEVEAMAAQIIPTDSTREPVRPASSSSSTGPRHLREGAQADYIAG